MKAHVRLQIKTIGSDRSGIEDEENARPAAGDRIEGCKNPRHFGEALRGDLSGLWRYRVGDYRIICQIQDERLVVLALAVGHRREVYERGR